MPEREQWKAVEEYLNLIATKKEFSHFPINIHRPNIKGKCTELLLQGHSDQYIGIGIEIVSMFRSWCLREVQKLQYFSDQLNENRPSHVYEVAECVVTVLSSKTFAAEPLQKGFRTENFFGQSSIMEKPSVKEIMD